METTYTTAAEDTARIRAELKARHGWNSRDISVRAENYSMGSAISIQVRKPDIPLAPVQAIAEGAEHIRRCEVTGEILSGGNQYVTVRYSDEVREIHGRRYADGVQRAVDAVEIGSNELKCVEGTRFLVGCPDAWRITLWDDDTSGMIQQCGSVEECARAIGRLMVEA